MKKNLLIIFFFLFAIYAFPYHAGLGTNVGSYSNTFDKVYILNVSSLNSIPVGTTGFAFVLQMNIPDRDSGSIFSVRNKSTNMTVFSLDFNSFGKIVVMRPYVGQKLGYEIYDKLLDYSSAGSDIYEFRIFVSASFIWLEVTNASNVMPAPLFFGINLPDLNVVDRILNRDSNYEIQFGGLSNISSTLLHTNLDVYANKYEDIRNDITTNYIPSIQTRATFQPSSLADQSLNVNLNIEVYPIPIESELNIDFNLKEAGNVEYEFYNIQGILIYRYNKFYFHHGNIKEIFAREDLSKISNMAILRVKTANGYSVKKINFK